MGINAHLSRYIRAVRRPMVGSITWGSELHYHPVFSTSVAGHNVPACCSAAQHRPDIHH